MSILTKFESFLSAAGKLFTQGLSFVAKEAPAVASLASILFPGATGTASAVVAAINLVQNTVISIEQKYAASGVQTGTGSQKAAEALILAGPAVTQLLTAAGVKNVSDDYVANLITAVVGILNAAQPAVAKP
jgi:hypothetical protein